MSEALGADPGAQRIDVAGRKGWRLSDGATLWDDGEKEVPTSGLSDEHKRALARIDAGDAYPISKTGVSDAEVGALQTALALAADPEKALEARKAAAKARAGRKPTEKDPPLPPTDVEVTQNLRIEAKKLLEREIDRLEELKSMAIAGLIMLARDGIKVPGGNPPMVLHEQVLTLLKVADSGTPRQMADALTMARAWMPLSTEDDNPPLPNPPSGVPAVPVVIPPPPDTQATPQASRDLKGGGQPTSYPPVPPLPDPLP